VIDWKSSGGIRKTAYLTDVVLAPQQKSATRSFGWNLEREAKVELSLRSKHTRGAAKVETGWGALRIDECGQTADWRDAGARRSERSRQIGFAGMLCQPV
jgi:hypothetical protein